MVMSAASPSHSAHAGDVVIAVPVPSSSSTPANGGEATAVAANGSGSLTAAAIAKLKEEEKKIQMVSGMTEMNISIGLAGGHKNFVVRGLHSLRRPYFCTP